MVDPDSIRDSVQRYVKLMNDGDADAVADLYADDGSIEDPVGARPHRGRENVRAFYRKSAGVVKLELTGPVRVCGGEAAFPMLGRLGGSDDPSYLDIIDVMKFDADGRIVSLRAYWSPDAIRKA